ILEDDSLHRRTSFSPGGTLVGRIGEGPSSSAAGSGPLSLLSRPSLGRCLRFGLGAREPLLQGQRHRGGGENGGIGADDDPDQEGEGEIAQRVASQYQECRQDQDRSQARVDRARYGLEASLVGQFG